MRLALIRQRYNPFGGAERFIERAIAALERGGAEITLITRAWDAGSGRKARIVDPPYAGRLWRDASFSRGVRSLLARERFDLVQSHERIPGCDLYRAGDGVHRQWLEHRAREAGFLERVGMQLNPYHWYTCAAERAMFAHPDLRAVICNSQMVAAEIRRHFDVPAEKLHVIYNGVDLDHFHPQTRQDMRAEARREFGCKEGDIVFSFVGSGFARKGLAAAIDALAAAGRSDFRLVIAGRDRATERFAVRAARAGVAGQVAFLGGRDDVRSVYAASDCFILPTRYDPFPNAALEALAMGVPVIVSSQCGAAEIVEQGRNGWVCAPDAVGPLAQLMLEAAGADGPGTAGAARRTAEGYGVERMADRMIGLYAMLLGERTAAAAAGHCPA
jgi:UDP-glucose:(heptosyl)LPS alpha-1,3-glucosyltransferase